MSCTKFRLSITRHVIHHGVQPTARIFGISPQTARKWHNVYKQNPRQKLLDKPHSFIHSHTMSTQWQERIKSICSDKRNFNARIIATHIKDDLKIPYSLKTIIKYIKKFNFPLFTTMKKRKRKHNNILWKKTLDFAHLIQVDIKYLTDIPELQFSLRKLSLPKYQITVRDVATGALWVCFLREKTLTNTSLFIEYLLLHLKNFGIDTSTITIQTDNGSEFTQNLFSNKLHAFTYTVNSFHATHKTIPPRSPTYNCDVEASHKLIEFESYSKMENPDNKMFFLSVHSYLSFLNLVRFNSNKGNSPKALLLEKLPSIDTKTPSLKPIIIDSLLTDEKFNT